MDSQKIKTSFFPNWWYWVLPLFISLLLCVSVSTLLKKESKSDWIKLPKQDKEKILKNQKLWHSWNETEKKRWKLCRERFNRYSPADQKFLQQLYYDWQRMPSAEKKRCLNCCKTLNTLPPDIQEKIKYQAIYLEGLCYDTGATPNAKVLEEWMEDAVYFEDLHNMKVYRQLSPVALRREIYQSIGILKMVTFLPPNLQNQWKKLTPETKVSILNQIQKQSEKQRRNLLIQLLKQKTHENNPNDNE